MPKEPPTKVLFRVHQGEVLALFPTMAGAVGQPSTCVCYAHVGQHSAADLHGVIYRSRPALPAEYEGLALELRRRGYVLDIRQRSTRADQSERLKQLLR